jgi:hypothetical protein
MEETEFLFDVVFFKRVMKCIKDHQCSLCGRTIVTGSSYFISDNRWPRDRPYLKYCEECFDQRLERPGPMGIQKVLDK